MEININGNPGSGNRYDDVKIHQVGSYNPNATEVHIHQQVGGQNSRMASWFRKLKEEIDHDDKLQKKMADIMRYRTKLPHTLGLKRKLQDGGYNKTAIDKACRLKQGYAKKTTKYQYYEMANRIDDYLFAILSNRFDDYVYPLIVNQRPLADIKQAVSEQVIIPVMKELNENGKTIFISAIPQTTS